MNIDYRDIYCEACKSHLINLDGNGSLIEGIHDCCCEYGFSNYEVDTSNFQFHITEDLIVYYDHSIQEIKLKNINTYEILFTDTSQKYKDIPDLKNKIMLKIINLL